MNGNGYSMAWAPAPNRRLPTPFLNKKPSLGQRYANITESKELALATDFVILLGSSFMAWGSTQRGNRWATFWWVVSGVTLIKGLHDLSRP
jgi:hypothetical protein